MPTRFRKQLRTWQTWLSRRRAQWSIGFRQRQAVVLGWVVAVGLTVLAQSLGLLTPLDERIFSRYERLRGNPSEDHKVLTLEIRGEDVARLGALPWGWPVWEEVFRRLSVGKARAVILASPASSLFPAEAPPADSRVLAQVGAGRLALPTGLEPSAQGGWRLLPLGLPWARGMRSPALAFLPDADGLLRRIPLRVSVEGGTAETVGAELLRLLEGGAGSAPSYDAPEGSGAVGAASSVPLRARLEGNSLALRFGGSRGALPNLPLWRVLDGQVDTTFFRDRVVAIGLGPALGRGIRFPGSPVEEPVGEAEVLAWASHALVSAEGLIALPLGLAWVAVIQLALALLMSRGATWRVLSLGGIAGLLWVGAGFLAFSQGLVLPVGTGVGGIVLLTGLISVQRLRRLSQLMADLERNTWRAQAASPLVEEGGLAGAVRHLHRLVQRFHPVHSLLLAVREPELRWLSFKAQEGAEEGDIKERRRDFGRDPYRSALERASLEPISGYMSDPDLRTYLIPLRYLEQVRGFLVVNLKQGQSEGAIRWLQNAAPELGMRIHQELLAEREKKVVWGAEHEQVLHRLEDSVQELFAQRGSLRSLLEDMSVGLLYAGRLGEVRVLNRALSELLNRCGVTSRTSSIIDVVAALSGLGAEVLEPRIARLLLHGEPFHFYIREPGERPGVFQANVTGLWTEGNAEGAASRRPPDGLVLTVVNVTEMRARDRLEHIYPQVQNHLNAILGYVSLLRGVRDRSAQERRWIKVLEDRSHQLSEVMNRWVFQVRPLGEGEQVVREPVDLVDVLQEVAQEVSRLRPGALQVVAPPVGVTPVYADRERIRRGMLALLESVLEDRAGGGSVRVRIEEGEGRNQRIRIEDALRAMPAQAVRRLFEPAAAGEVESPASTEQGPALARRLLLEAGGAVQSGGETPSGHAVTIEFPKFMAS